MGHRTTQALLNDFGELKYITHAREKLVWVDPLEPSVMLNKYLSGVPLRAIASQHGRSIDQLRDFAAKVKAGVITAPIHFACIKEKLVYPDVSLKLPAEDLFRDGSPVNRATQIYKVPGKDCYFGATTGFLYDQVPSPRFLQGDSLGLEGDTCHTIHDGSLSVSAAFKRTFWDQLTEHSVVIFNTQILSCIAPWARDYCKPSLDINLLRHFLPETPSVLEDMLYIEKGVLHSFTPDVITANADHYAIHLRVRGAKVTFKIDVGIIMLLSEMLGVGIFA